MSTRSLDDQQPLTATPYVIRRFQQADAPEDFERAMALRLDVFVQEQAVPVEEEQDVYDEEAIHWLVLNVETLESLATARMTPYQEACQMRPVAKIGRVAVKQSMRGKGFGELILQEVLATVIEAGYDQAILDAQVPVVPFYEKFGFVTEGDSFLDAGILHYRMRRVFN